MNKILVPVDFSEQCINAFRFSLDIAKQTNAIVTLLHVVALPVIHDSSLMSVSGFRKTLVDELKDAAEEKFAILINEFNDAQVKVDTKVVTGPIHTSILSCIQDGRYDLIIMGTRGATGVREWTIGSNTEKVVRTSPVPLIAIKAYQPAKSIRHIVFPNTLDTENQEDLVMKIKALQNFFDATLHIIWINTPAVHKAEDEVRERLKAFAGRFMLRNYTINVFSYTNEEAGIIEFTREVNGDLIAMGTHGLRGLAHIFSGSIAEDVVNHVKLPVWTYCTHAAKTLSVQE